MKLECNLYISKLECLSLSAMGDQEMEISDVVMKENSIGKFIAENALTIGDSLKITIEKTTE